MSDARDPAPDPEPLVGPTTLSQSDNRPNDCDPDETVPQDANWEPQ